MHVVIYLSSTSKDLNEFAVQPGCLAGSKLVQKIKTLEPELPCLLLGRRSGRDLFFKKCAFNLEKYFQLTFF